MSSSLSIRWTIVPRTAPRPWLSCSGCRAPRPFEPSGKARLNANGRKLDAWLVYRCTSCGKTWNRPLFARQSVGDIDPAVLDALQRNDPGWIRARAFDIAALRRHARRIDTFAETDMAREVLTEADGWSVLEMVLVAPLAPATRLDRLLAGALAMSRTRIDALHRSGALTTGPDRRDMLRRPARDGTRIAIDLADDPMSRAAWKAAALGAG